MRAQVLGAIKTDATWGGGNVGRRGHSHHNLFKKFKTSIELNFLGCSDERHLYLELNIEVITYFYSVNSHSEKIALVDCEFR